MSRWLSKLWNRASSLEVCCSFCRKGRSEAEPFVEGPGPGGAGGVFLCRSCAELAISIFDQEQVRHSTGPENSE